MGLRAVGRGVNDEFEGSCPTFVFRLFGPFLGVFRGTVRILVICGNNSFPVQSVVLRKKNAKKYQFLALSPSQKWVPQKKSQFFFGLCPPL